MLIIPHSLFYVKGCGIFCAGEHGSPLRNQDVGAPSPTPVFYKFVCRRGWRPRQPVYTIVNLPRNKRLTNRILYIILYTKEAQNENKNNDYMRVIRGGNMRVLGDNDTDWHCAGNARTVRHYDCRYSPALRAASAYLRAPRAATYGRTSLWL